MNEQFRKLLKQAEERYPRHLAVAVPEVQLRQDALDKFAELIVQECAQICKTVGAADVIASKEYQEGREMGTEVCYNMIKLHFNIDFQERIQW